MITILDTRCEVVAFGLHSDVEADATRPAMAVTDALSWSFVVATGLQR